MMFDGVVCEYELPLPDDLGELSHIDWKDFEFQTSSLGNTLSKYTIEEDGQIYEEKSEEHWTDDEEHPNGGYIQIRENGIEKSFFTGELILSALVLKDEYDYILGFKALFWKGDLKEIELSEWEKEDNKERIKREKEFKKVYDRALEKTAKQGFLINFCKGSVSLTLWITRWILMFFVKMAWKLERWLT